MNIQQKNNNQHLFRMPKVKTVIGRMDFVLESCKDKKVLHLGCVDEGLTEERIKDRNFLHFKLMDVAEEVWGIDISEQGITLLKSFGVDNLIVADIERVDEIEELKKHKFDIILLAEVLEHLNNPGMCLQGLQKLFAKDTVMIVTVPNGLRFTGLNHQIRGFEFVHPDHNYWFSYKTLKTLMEKNGYHIDELLVYSFFNYILSASEIVGKIWRGVLSKPTPKKGKKTGRNIQVQQTKQCNIIVSLYSFVKCLPICLVRKYISKRNPFFAADGIIAVVSPEKGPTS